MGLIIANMKLCSWPKMVSALFVGQVNLIIMEPGSQWIMLRPLERLEDFFVGTAITELDGSNATSTCLSLL